MDIAGHLERTGHITLQPVSEYMHLMSASKTTVRIPNISYTEDWGQKVRRKWKALVMRGTVTYKLATLRSHLICI
jgi:hypothetical protein